MSSTEQVTKFQHYSNKNRIINVVPIVSTSTIALCKTVSRYIELGLSRFKKQSFNRQQSS